MFLDAPAQDGIRVVTSELSGEQIFHEFVHNGTLFFVSAANANKRSMKIWKIDDGPVLVDTIALDGTGAFEHANDPRFFACTKKWIYYINKADRDLQEQLYRTDGIVIERLSDFSGTRPTVGATGFFGGADHNGGGGPPFFMHHVLESEPDHLYFLAANKDYISVSAIKDNASTTTVVDEHIIEPRSFFRADGLRSIFIVIGTAVFTSDVINPESLSNQGDEGTNMIANGSTRLLTYNPAVAGISFNGRTLREKIAGGDRPETPGGFFNQDYGQSGPLSTFRTPPWQVSEHAIIQRNGVERMIFFQEIMRADIGGRPTHEIHMVYVPLTGSSAWEINVVDWSRPATFLQNDIPKPITVMHGGVKKALFFFNDEYGDRHAVGDPWTWNFRRGMALFITDGSGVGTYRLGYIGVERHPNPEVLIVEQEQEGDIVYMRIAYSDRSGDGGQDVKRSFLAVNVAGAVVDTNGSGEFVGRDATPTGHITRIANEETQCIVRYGHDLYFEKAGDLWRIAAGSTTAPTLVFDTGDKGVLSKERPVVVNNKLRFIAKKDEVWRLYSYDGTSVSTILFLGEDADPKALTTADSREGTLFMVANNSIYLVDDVPPTSPSLVVDEGAENAVISFTPTEDARYYWVLTSSNSSPSISQIRAGRAHDGTAALFHNVLGNQVIYAGMLEGFELTELAASKTYYLHLVVQDTTGRAANIITQTITTASSGMADTNSLVPLLLSEPLRVTKLEHDTATLTYTPNQGGMAYWVSIPADDPAPTQVQVEAGRAADDSLLSDKRNSAGNGVITAEMATDIIVGIGAPNTDCRLYLVAEDGSSRTAMASTLFTSQDVNTNPYALSVDDFVVTPSTIDRSTAAATFTASRDGEPYYWVVQPADLPFLRRNHLLAGENAMGLPTNSGNGNTAAVMGEATTFEITSLVVGTTYTLYLTFERNGDYLAVQSYTFTAGTPLVSFGILTPDPTTGTLPVAFTTTLAGSFYWVVQGAMLPPPSHAAIKNGNSQRAPGFASTTSTLTDTTSTGNHFTVRNLRYSGSYKVYVLLTNSGGNLITSEGSAPIPYTAPATTGTPSTPALTAQGAVTDTPIDAHRSTLTFTSDMAGRYYWVMQGPSVSGIPTAAQVTVGLNAAGHWTRCTNGSTGSPMDANVEASFVVNDLEIGVAYVLYMVLENLDVTAASTVFSYAFTHERPPTPAPVFTRGPTLAYTNTPIALEVSATFTPNVDGTYSWAFLPTVESGSTIPSGAKLPANAAALDAGDHQKLNAFGSRGDPNSGNNEAMEASVRETVRFPIVLERVDAFDWSLYIVLKNEAGVLSDMEILPIIYTPPFVPSFTSNLTLSQTGSGDNLTYEIAFTVSEDPTTKNNTRSYWVALSPSRDYPQQDKKIRKEYIAKGFDGDARPLPLSISGSAQSSLNEAQRVIVINAAQLREEVVYKVYVVLTNREGSRFSEDIKTISIDRSPSAMSTAPAFRTLPLVSGGDATTVTVAFTPDASGRYYWLVQPSTLSNAPDVHHIKNGQNGNGEAVASEHTAPTGNDMSAAEQSFSIDGLAASIEYTLYLFLESGDGSAQSEVAGVSFTSMGGSSAPMSLGTTEGTRVAMRLSPNPVRDLLNVMVPEAGALLLYDLSGRRLATHQVVVGSNAVPFGSYQPGVYMVQLSLNGRDVYHRRVVKQ